MEITAHVHSHEIDKISEVDPDQDPRGQKLPLCFEVLDVLFGGLRAEGFVFFLDVLHRGLVISTVYCNF